MSHGEDKLNLPAAEKRALLAELLRKKAERQTPLSFAQQRLWFMDQLDPESPSYNISRAIRIKGHLNFHALHQALNSVIARHESLRANFVSFEGEPSQVIANALQIEIQVSDLRVLQQALRESEARRLASEESRRGFNLANDALLRARLIKLDDQDQVLLLVMHHIISDGWSMDILFRELSTLYETFCKSLPSPLPALPIQYGDFARWQREFLQGAVLEQQVNFWKDQLTGAPAMLELPTDEPRPLLQTFAGAYQHALIDKKVTESLKQLSRREGATLFMILFAAFQVLLHRYTNQNDIVVGTPIANRTRTETESLIGLFVNTLVLRTDLSGNPSFRELLARVREVALDAFAHQDLPFEKLVEELQPERHLGHMPLFQILFALQNVPKSTLALGPLVLTDFPFTKSTSKLDLSLYVAEREDGLSLSFEYSTDLFEAATIERMTAQFQTLLDAVGINPELRINELPVLTSPERQQLLVEWNDTRAEYPTDRCIHELFEEQVQRTPDEVALIFETTQLTYRELNRRANKLANFLKGFGVGPDVFVGICAERSSEMIVGILAILKAGGAYIALDPAHPADRITFMLRDSAARLLLTQERFRESLGNWGNDVVYVDSDWPQIAVANDDNLANTACPENAAYVLYTSGSTGQPKGVVSPHYASLNRFSWMWKVYPFSPGEVCCQKTSLSFGDSVWEIFGPLLQGVPLVLISDAVVKDPQLFLAALAINKVSRLVLVPSLLRIMLSYGEDLKRQLSALRYCVSSGETLPAELAAEFCDRVPQTTLINLYGSSEVAADVLCYEVRNTDGVGAIPIGKPIDNTTILILDPSFQLTPLGVLGEICVAGDGLARGYLNAQRLTAEKFVPHPFSPDGGARMFRTGDIGRYLLDGTIEYHGRRDHQVKVRGYRIELGEIESHLLNHPRVHQAVVIAKESVLGEHELLAYVVPREEAPTDMDLRAHLRTKLPDYMLPAAFVLLEAMPLTASGKVNRLGLPQPTRLQLKTESANTSTTVLKRGTEDTHVAPRDDLERRLAHIWEKLLGVETVGIRDNFFDLGGHSLLAVRLVAEIEKQVGQRLPLISLFQGADIENLANLLRQDVRSLSWPTLVEIQTGGTNAPLFCVSHPNVNALGYRSLARYLGESQPVFGLQAQYPEDLEGEYSDHAVDKMATEYLKALRDVRPSGPYQFVGICRGAHIAYEIARRLEHEGQKVLLLGILDTWVAENTYNLLWYVDHYLERLYWLKGLAFGKQISFIKSKTKKSLRNLGHRISALTLPNSAKRKQNPLHEVYFPGPNFVPKIYGGRIEVFRVRKQPRQRVNDPQLGWGKLAGRGAGIHFIPGSHEDLLKEPHVQGLAAELKKCLLQQSEQHRAKLR